VNRSEWSEQVRIGPFRIRVSRSEWSGVSSRDTGSDQPSDQHSVSSGKAAGTIGHPESVGVVFGRFARACATLPAVIDVELRYRRTTFEFKACYKWLKSVVFTAHG